MRTLSGDAGRLSLFPLQTVALVSRTHEHTYLSFELDPASYSDAKCHRQNTRLASRPHPFDREESLIQSQKHVSNSHTTAALLFNKNKSILLHFSAVKQ